MMKLRFKATSPMKRNLPGSWKQLKDIPIPRPSNSARSNGITTPKKKLRGNAKMIFEKTTHTFLLTNRNLEDEIHLKGVRCEKRSEWPKWKDAIQAEIASLN